MENIKTFYNSDKSLAYVRIEFVHEDDFNYLDQCIDAYEIIDCDFKEGISMVSIISNDRRGYIWVIY